MSTRIAAACCRRDRDRAESPAAQARETREQPLVERERLDRADELRSPTRTNQETSRAGPDGAPEGERLWPLLPRPCGDAAARWASVIRYDEGMQPWRRLLRVVAVPGPRGDGVSVAGAPPPTPIVYAGVTDDAIPARAKNYAFSTPISSSAPARRSATSTGTGAPTSISPAAASISTAPIRAASVSKRRPARCRRSTSSPSGSHSPTSIATAISISPSSARAACGSCKTTAPASSRT